MNKVLIVDDNQLLLDGLALSLRKAQFTLLTANSVQAALACLERQTIDIIVADFYLSGNEGGELLRQCYKRWPTTLRVILSGHVDPQIALSAINDFKVSKFLTKPCPPKNLITTLEELLQEQQLSQGRDDLIDYALSQLLGTQHGSEPAPDYDSAIQEHVASLVKRGSISKREAQVLRQILFGHRLSRISENLHISVHTVRNHLKSIFNKLKVHSQQELVDTVITQIDFRAK